MATIRKCGICRQVGHNRSNCNTAGYESVAAYYANKKKVGIANRQCSFCKNMGHTKNKCESRETVRNWWIQRELLHRANVLKSIVENGIGPNAVMLRKTGSNAESPIVMRTVYELKIRSDGSQVSTVDAWNMDRDYFKTTTDVVIHSRCMTPNIEHYTATPSYQISMGSCEEMTKKLSPTQLQELEDGEMPQFLMGYEWYLAYGGTITEDEARKCVDVPDFFTQVREEDMPNNLRKMPRKTSKKSSEEEDDEDENE